MIIDIKLAVTSLTKTTTNAYAVAPIAMSLIRRSATKARPLFSSPRPRYASNWSRHTAYPSFFSHTPKPRFSFWSRRMLWVVPVAGGLTLFLTPEQKSFLPGLFSSPTIIPCHPERNALTPTVYSPAELDLNIFHRLKTFFLTKIWEPIRTAQRFLTLVTLFLPVLLTSPMLLVGKPERRLNGDRWGAVWWYKYLVTKMQAAGPTFIKVHFVTLF